MKEFTFNIFAPITLIVSIIICAFGKVSWWVFILIMLSQLQLNITWRIK